MLNIRSTYHRNYLCPFLGGAIAALLLLCAPSARASELVIDGAGFGHGVGMSQEGALGYALHGLDYSAILARYYAGTALGQAPAGAQVRVLIGGRVQRIPLESYVRGVVSAEVPASWPLAALEAQAVASRTYALTAHAGGSRFDVYADTRSQVYRGVVAQTPQTDAAVAATAGQILTFEGQPAITYFFASSGGHTESVENAFPGAQAQAWLRGVPDPYDQGSLHRWNITMTFASAASRLKGLVRGVFRGVEVLARGVSPRILSANVLGSGGRTAVSGPQLAARLGLYDAWAYFSVKSGARISPEPDRSGRPPAAGPSSARRPAARTPSARPAPRVSPPAPPAGREGGVHAPGGAEASSTGGTAAS